jgi:hypothetical protein
MGTVSCPHIRDTDCESPVRSYSLVVEARAATERAPNPGMRPAQAPAA